MTDDAGAATATPEARASHAAPCIRPLPGEAEVCRTDAETIADRPLRAAGSTGEQMLASRGATVSVPASRALLGRFHAPVGADARLRVSLDLRPLIDSPERFG